MVKQILLFCLHCSGYMPPSDYTELITRALVICLWCGKVVLCGDIHEPNYKRDLMRRIEIEKRIRSLCALTGRTVAEIEALIKEQNLSIPDLDYLIGQIAKGERKLDED